MSLLTPLYIAGLLAVGLPILFHLIRRTPQGRQLFSSSMFLQVSPPRTRKRSSLEHWPLLLLRALIICLLAVAFARPFFRSPDAMSQATPDAKQVVILLDTSASMLRDDLWLQAQAEVTRTLENLNHHDAVCLLSFHEQVTTHITPGEWQRATPAARKAWVTDLLAKLQPDRQGTSLGKALLEAVAVLRHADQPVADVASRQIVLISDMQSGATLEELQQQSWPEDVQLLARPVVSSNQTNAGVQLLQAAADEEQAEPVHRVRISNSSESVDEQFELAHGTEQTPVYVPAGQSRVFTIPAVGGENITLQLRGDDHPFDNTVALQAPELRHCRLICFGDEPATDTAQPFYYLQRSFTDTAMRKTELVRQASDSPLLPDFGFHLAVVTRTLTAAELSHLRRYLDQGGQALIPLSSSISPETVAALLGKESVRWQEATVGEYALLTDLDFRHDWFQEFAPADFADFTGIHTWKHRTLVAEDFPGARVLARFDSKHPAILEVPRGAGRVLLLTSSWRPEDSQLALSSKFAPLLNRLLERPAPSSPEDLELISAETDAAAEPRPELAPLPPGETQTAPLDLAQLEALGVQLQPVSQPPGTDAERQLKARELEQRQQLWRWLMVAAVVALIAETLLAGRLARNL